MKRLLNFLCIICLMTATAAHADYAWKYPALADKYTHDSGVVTLTESDDNSRTYTVKKTQTTSSRPLYLSGNTASPLPANHKYFMKLKLKSNFTQTPYLRYPINGNYDNLNLKSYQRNEWSTGAKIVTPTQAWQINSTDFGILPATNGYVQGETITVEKDGFVKIFDLTEIFGAGNEPTTVTQAEELLLDIPKITIATTKYTEDAFANLVTTLESAINKVTNIVDTTVQQATEIGELAQTKQDRPETDCPAGRKCLLIMGADNKPHWYLIQE